MPMISDRVFRAENSIATIESADPRSVQNKGYFLPNANIFAAADKVDARQLEATIAKPPSYLTIDDELWYHNLIDHKLQESMRGVTFNTELRMPYETPVASSLWGLLRMGIYDLGNGEGRWPGATRSQHYTAAWGKFEYIQNVPGHWLLSVQRAAEAVRLVAQLIERVEGWSAQRTLDQTTVDSARNRLRTEVQLAVAHRLEEARVVEMVDEETVESASEGTEEEIASAEEYWQTRS
ncbi:hypothetical protein BJ322DRAFT_1022076 [Thelephora terrestris]|uniref:Uncharacterized protein n=1 Tax=Thelephora terrestris TaxID=56493 RepID=A0A9P6HBB6_9AGAM|nr:hypothetical protein BJ322DRAFT_1022076 [Thelephora terrestris]